MVKLNYYKDLFFFASLQTISINIETPNPIEPTIMLSVSAMEGCSFGINKSLYKLYAAKIRNIAGIAIPKTTLFLVDKNT